METTEEIKENILLTIDDLVTDFTYYDRKECEELTEEILDNAIESKIITIDEMVERFKAKLKEVYPGKKK